MGIYDAVVERTTKSYDNFKIIYTELIYGINKHLLKCAEYSYSAQIVFPQPGRVYGLSKQANPEVDTRYFINEDQYGPFLMSFLKQYFEDEGFDVECSKDNDIMYISWKKCLQKKRCQKNTRSTCIKVIRKQL